MRKIGTDAHLMCWRVQTGYITPFIVRRAIDLVLHHCIPGTVQELDDRASRQRGCYDSRPGACLVALAITLDVNFLGLQKVQLAVMLLRLSCHNSCCRKSAHRVSVG